jgi:putative oxidoreductase
MDVVFLAGRILFALIFINSGVMGHLIGRSQAVGYARAYGTPAPELSVPLTGLVIIAGGLSVALGVFADLGALMLVAFLLPAAFFLHAFWKEEDEQMQQVQMAQFMKNVAMVGGALVIFYVYNQLQGDAPLSLTDPLFGRG